MSVLRIILPSKLAFLWVFLVSLSFPFTVLALEDTQGKKFYQSIQEILDDFEYDLRNGNVQGTEKLSIRNLASNIEFPNSFYNYLEEQVAERILKGSQSQVIQCLPCKANKPYLAGKKVSHADPSKPPQETARLARYARIKNFMDIGFIYESDNISILLTVLDAGTDQILWNHIYELQTSRTSALRRGVDYNQVDESNRLIEKNTTTQSRILFYYLFERDLPEWVGCFVFGYRWMDRYHLRTREVGIEMNYMVNASTLMSTQGSSDKDIYSGFKLNLTLLFLHTWNFFSDREGEKDRIGSSVTLGAGGTYAPGFLGPLARGTYEWRLFKNFGLSVSLGYRPPGNAYLNNKISGSISGLEYGIGSSFIF